MADQNLFSLPQDVQGLLNQKTPQANQQIAGMVQSGQVSYNDLVNQIGQDKVDWFVNQNPQYASLVPGNTATPAATPTTVPTAKPTGIPGPDGWPANGGVAKPGNLGGAAVQNMGNPNPVNNPTTYPTPIPKAPDYWQSAEAQGAANLNAAKNTVSLSNPDINNPFGSQTVSIGPDGRPVVNQSLSPEMQARMGKLNTILPGLSDQIAAQLGKQPGWHVTQQVDSPSAGGVQSLADTLRAREQPRLDRQRAQTQTQLLARGFNPQDEAYKAAMDELNRSENDFGLGLISQAGQEQSRLFNLQSALRGQQTGEEQLLRTLPIQNYAQLVSAMQPTMPQFQQYQGATVESTPYFNATNAQGLFDLGRYGTMIQGELGTRNTDNAISNGVWNNLTGLLYGK